MRLDVLGQGFLGLVFPGRRASSVKRGQSWSMLAGFDGDDRVGSGQFTPQDSRVARVRRTRRAAAGDDRQGTTQEAACEPLVAGALHSAECLWHIGRGWRAGHRRMLLSQARARIPHRIEQDEQSSNVVAVFRPARTPERSGRASDASQHHQQDEQASNWIFRGHGNRLYAQCR